MFITIFETVFTLVGVGMMLSTAPTVANIRETLDGALYRAVFRFVVGGLILMASWKFFFSENALVIPSPRTAATIESAPASK